MNNQGFTLKELLMVIVVIGILCGAAIPQFYSLQRSRRQTEMEKVVGIVQAGVVRDGKATGAGDNKQVTFPEKLDNEPMGKVCHNCFGLILDKGVESPLWYKRSDSEYLYSRNGNSGDEKNYLESGDFKVIYDRKNGNVMAVPVE